MGKSGPVTRGLHVGCQARVIVPDLSVDVELHKPHTAFDQPAGNQTAATVGIGRIATDSIEFQRLARFLSEIKGIRRGHLHPCGKFVTGDAGGKTRLKRTCALMQFIQVTTLLLKSGVVSG